MSPDAARPPAFRGEARKLHAAVEEHLSTGVFGDGAAIAGTAAAYYRGAARVCAGATGTDPAAVAPTGRPYAESLRRAAVDEALRECSAGRPENGGEALARYIALNARMSSDAELEADLEMGEENAPEFPRIGPDHWVSRHFLGLFGSTTTVGGAPVEALPAAVTPQAEAARARAVALARRGLPRLAGDVLAAARRVVPYRGEQPYSGYTNAAPLLVFVAEQTFRQDRLAAELLVHESLHQKLNDISLARSLFRPDYHDERSATVSVPWSFGSGRTRHFSADRTFAAFHVYTHQALLYLGLAVTEPDEERAGGALAETVLAWARAAHFARALDGGPVTAELGPDGHRLTRWLTTAVDALGELRLPDGSALAAHSGAVTPHAA
ncbi:hypothetical protein ACIA8O_35895 [Kitasatospora sp. NPDC051853]|uniref:hypothetical protein n=1 Tax=Kitasatospora sp. NPDC051853 TaxID=3364058 RepID=UPI00379131C1